VGAKSVEIDGATGDLVIEVATTASPQSIRDKAPVAWQEVGGQRVPVAVRYMLTPDEQVGLAIGAYDPAAPLVIDR